MSESFQKDIIKNVLVISIVGALLLACFWILRPFLPSLVWASMIVIATWPLLILVEQKVHGRHRAVVVMICILILVFVIPFTLAVGTIVENSPQIINLAKQLSHLEIPAPPAWLHQIPVIGETATDLWQKAKDAAPEEFAKRFTPYLRDIAGWLVAQAGTFGKMFIHFIVTLIFTALLYMNGQDAALMVRRLAHRIAEDRGEHAVILAALSVRAVAQGVVITALAQSTLAGIGLAVVGIPYTSLLTAMIFMLTIAQIGPGPVLIPAIFWLFWKDDTAWAIALLIWSVIVMGMDGFLRPFLIKRNANLPLLLIFAGVIGGLFAFGVIGLFIGPVVLAVCFTLMKAWVDDDPSGDQLSSKIS